MNSNGAVWFDFDRDGLLDLYITGYFDPTSISGICAHAIMQESWDSPRTVGRTSCSESRARRLRT